jgi:ADP-heptose:LPS heptosyltransferase
VRRLLIRPGAIGDVILSLPAMEAARAEYTEVWAPRPMLPLIQFADHTRAIADTGLDLVGVVEGARCEALTSFDSIYSWYGSNRAEFREAVRHLPFEFFPALPPPPGIPRIRALYGGPPGPQPASWPAQAGRKRPAPTVSSAPHVVIHPFASSAAKRWPLENYRALAAQLPAPVQWCAGPEEPLAGAVGIDDLYQLACWLSTACLYIGNDSGIAHLAAAVGTPVIAIFLASDPLIWAPRGERVLILERPVVDDVLAAARLHLGGFEAG